ncbi:DUF2637 domain-containing protein [Isoptericola croceus]|uniref:DUF2637 domain-containing protein n=1 Tax=Isoptericola croceus TaxID=3031406 RepID=UPI0034D39B1E
MAFALWPGVLLCTVAAVMAFTLSFSALRAVGIASGIAPRVAWMFPLTIDSVILFGTWAAFRFRARGAAGTWYAWVLCVFAAASWTGNFLHAERDCCTDGCHLIWIAPRGVARMPPCPGDPGQHEAPVPRHGLETGAWLCLRLRRDGRRRDG